MTWEPIEAVLFDLDDTIYPQGRWLATAWRTVAMAGAARGLDRQALEAALVRIAAEGSARGRIIDRAVRLVDGTTADVPALIDAFRSHRAVRLEPYPGAREVLERLRGRVGLALVTDGDVALQESKIDALEIRDCFDLIVLSDALGRDHRKPDPAPFQRALLDLGVEPGGAIAVGDHPDKDIVGASRLGMRAVRVRTGEYRTVPDVPGTWASVADISAAGDLLDLRLVTDAVRAG